MFSMMETETRTAFKSVAFLTSIRGEERMRFKAKAQGNFLKLSTTFVTVPRYQIRRC